MSENDDARKGEGNPLENNSQLPQKPKKIKRLGVKNDPSRSKSAPIETLAEEENDNNYIASYNYYVYYNSLKPVDPRLPKPTYNPKPNLDFIRESKKELEEDETPENQNMNTKVENITNEIDKLNLDTNPINSMNNTGVNNANENNKMNPNNQEDENFANFKKNYSQSNSNPKLNNNININNNNDKNQDAPSPLLDYYFNQPSNDTNPQRIGENIYTMPQMLNTPPNIRSNPLNPIYGMNQFNNLPYYENMLPTYNPQNLNADQFNNFYQKNQKLNPLNKLQDNFEYQNQINMNMLYPNQRLGQFYPQSNPMMNMGYNMNYFPNDPNINLPPQIPGFKHMGNVPNEASIPLSLNVPMNFQYNIGGLNNPQKGGFPIGLGNPMLQNQRFGNNIQNKKKQNKENLLKKDENKSLDDIIEKAVAYSKDHTGSRQIQKKYEEGPQEVRDKIFEKLKPEILNLSKDIFGNYAIQKVLEFKDAEKNAIIMESIQGHVAELSLNMYGCRVMQQLITVIDRKYLPQITKELEDKFEKCIEDQNGNHVIQKLIQRLNVGENSKIFEVVYNKLIQLAKHTYGCRVIQTLLKKCNEQQINKILQKIYENVVDLSMDQYGNYIIQYILENKIVKNVEPIYKGIKGNIFEFSKHKFASNVVEKTLTLGNKEQRKNIINEILILDDEKKDCIFTLTKDKFGNYVVQKMIEYSDEKTKKDIINRIISNPGMKKKEGFTKHVINFIEKINGVNQQQDFEN